MPVDYEIRYDYVDADGKLRFYVFRFPQKRFVQAQPDEDVDDGVIWNLDGVERVLYNLPQVLSSDGKPVVVVEGEKDSDRLAALGFVATTCAQGAGKWDKTDDTPLYGRHVIIIPDADGPGWEHARQIATALHGKAESVRILELPDLADRQDVSDWLDAGGTADRLRELMTEAPLFVPSSSSDDDGGGGGAEVRQSVASVLVALADEAELWHDNAKTYATIEVDDHREHLPIRSKAFRAWIARNYYTTTQRAPNGQAMSDAIETINARALFDGPNITAHVRIAEHGGAYWLDLCDDSWRAIEITPDGWRIVDGLAVRFIRYPGMLPLPEPERGGSVDELQHLVNVPNEQWPLVVAWMLQALRPVGPYPVMDLDGEQGSGKSTTSRMLRDLIDPNGCALRAEPREQRDLCIALSHSWVQAYDNMSRTPPWLSDALCRAATGGGFAIRELYSDDGEILFNAMRPVLVNGIEQVATRPDLLDRALVLTLPTIPEHRRRTEVELRTDFERVRPRVLGALLHAICVAMRDVGKVELHTLPRMADFALWVTAGESALGLRPGEFVDAYTAARSQANDLAIESSAVGPTVLSFMADRVSWTGTTKDLLAELVELADDSTKRQRGWPGTPRGLSGALRRLGPNLRAAGVEYEAPQRIGRGGLRVLTLRKVGTEPSPPTPSTPDVPGTTENGLFDGIVGDSGDDQPSDQPSNRHRETPVSGSETGFGDGGDDGDDLAGGFSCAEEIEQWTG